MIRVIFIFLLAILSLNLQAQQNAKPDIIFKLSGEEVKARVTEITDTEVKFSYIGETLVYSLKKSEIFKINFGSGRTEVYTKPAAPAESAPAPPSSTAPAAAPAAAATTTASTEESRNKIAILPFSYIKDGQRTAHELSEKVQGEVFAYMNKHAGIYSYQEPRTTNALLIKAGVTDESIKGFTMDEICKILGVEYVMEGIVTVNVRNQTNYGSNNYNTTSKNNNKTSTTTDKKTTGSTYSTSQVNYETTLLLNIFNDKGSSAFSQEKKSVWSTQDSYKSALEYLLKRTPVYSK
jgi:TolB-like protein